MTDVSRVIRAAASLLTALPLATVLATGLATGLVAAVPAAQAAAPAVGLEGAGAPRAHGSGAHTHLLDGSRLPKVDGHAWRTGEAHDGAVGACQKTELETIGAVEAVGTTYVAEQGITAVQVVGRFADAKSAWRAHRVLVAWRDDCEGRVEDASVGPLEAVEVRTGRGASYVGSFRTRSAGLGILRSGRFLTVVEVATDTADYPRRWSPARVAVRRIAKTF